MAESFFEFRERLTSTKGKPPAARSSTATPRETITVTQLTRQIDKAIKTLPQTFLVRAEVSNVSLHGGSGHLYFTLKDENACIDGVMFRSDAERLKFKPRDGMELLATGSVRVYAQRGRYQLYVTRLEPLGQGALEAAFQQLRKKLEAEGLFSQARKKLIPPYPLKIALITGEQAAALADMVKVLGRFQWLQCRLFAVPVQGVGAAEKIAAMIRRVNTLKPEVILLARGGGSLEDLWAFNEEIVARAIAASAVPIVTGIGHEVDTSIADLVADHHAHTPTEAAQVITARWKNVDGELGIIAARLGRCVRDQLSNCGHRVDGVRRHEFFRRPFDIVNVLRQRLDDRQQALRVALNARVWNLQRDLNELSQSLAAHHPKHGVSLLRQRIDALSQRLSAGASVAQQRRLARLDSIERALRAVSPDSVLHRGFSLTTLKKDGAIVRTAKQVTGGEKLLTRTADGTIESTADDPKQPKLFD